MVSRSHNIIMIQIIIVEYLFADGRTNRVLTSYPRRTGKSHGEAKPFTLRCVHGIHLHGTFS